MKKCNCTSSERALSFYKEMKDRLLQFIPVCLCIIGDGIISTNAEEMRNSVEFTSQYNKKKYKIESHFKITEL